MPHPDDEAVFVSGLLHKLVQDSVKTRVLVMTRGEKSTLRYGLKPADDLATVRVKEQHQAFKIIGIRDYQIFDLPDGVLEAKSKEIKLLLTKEIRQFNPTYLITLEPDGIYGHPDHVALTRIVSSFGSKTIKILYATLPPTHFLPSAKHMAKKKTIKPLVPDYKLNLTLKGMITKFRTLKAHRSQLHPVKNPGAYFFFLTNQLLLHEYYTYQT